MKRFVLILCAALLPVCAQTLTALSAELVSYLQLTPQQVTDMGKIQADWIAFQSSRFQRMSQVQIEIAQETQRSPLDPMALGLRYAEVETIRRELTTENAAVGERMRGLLTEAQKNKVKTLEEAAKLLPLISQAQCTQLLTPAVYTTPWFNTADFLLGTPTSIISLTGALNPCPYFGSGVTGSRPAAASTGR